MAALNVLSAWLETYFDEVTPKEFYRTVFPEGALDVKGAFTKGRYAGIIVMVMPQEDAQKKPRIRRISLTDDLDAVDEVVASESFCLCSPMSYAGKRRLAENARYLYAVAIDVDKLRIRGDVPVGLRDLWEGHIERAQRVPKPTFIVSSGTGVHLYYVLETPIPMYQDVAMQLQRLKRRLTQLVWNEGVVDIKDDREIQQEGIYQGFRMPGTITKRGDRVRVFETGDRVTLEYLGSFVPEAFRAKLRPERERQGLRLAEAAQQYPEWYERRVVRKEPKGVWHVSRNVYDWWKREILSGARVGHRYYCLMTLAMYAQKCSLYDAEKNPNPVTREELERDSFEIMEYFESLTVDEDNHFGADDVLDALEAFDEKWTRYPRQSIEFRSGIAIPANKRNGRKQADHLVLMRAMKQVRKQLGEDVAGGRRSKETDVLEWQAAHPSGKKSECAKETGLSRTTINKYWKNTEKIV